MAVYRGVFLLSFTVVFGSNVFRSDYEYSSLANGWLKYHQAPATWEYARITCDFEGAVLASPLYQDLTDAIYNTIGKVKNPRFWIYTGYHSMMPGNSFLSVEGTPVRATEKLQVSFEEYNGSSSCMRLMPQIGLYASNCVDLLPFVCYKRKDTDLILTECGTVDKGYKLDSRTGHCYKFHNDPLTWPMAHMRCDAEGGYLAIANSDLEANIFKDLFSKYPEASIIGGYKNGIHLGFYDWNNKGVWRTLHGVALEQAGYKNWSKGQPDNNGGNPGRGQHFGSMFRTGLLDDIQDTLPSAFICERNPESYITGNMPYVQ